MRFGIIGHPVAGSMSPRLFGAAYDGRYPYDLLDYEQFADAWARFLDGYDGINVTAPYKQDAFAHVKKLSDNARLSGAVNLVVRDGLSGYNTDVDGVLYALTSGVSLDKGFDALGAAHGQIASVAARPCSRQIASVAARPCPLMKQGVSSRFQDCDALVVGAGGAARAAVVAAKLLGCSVTVCNRTLSKAATLADELNCDCIPLADVSSIAPDLIIYTLPGSAPVPEGLPFASAIVLEAEYKAPVLARIPCRAYLSGRFWLLGQAAAGYELFTGEKPSVEKMLQVL